MLVQKLYEQKIKKKLFSWLVFAVAVLSLLSFSYFFIKAKESEVDNEKWDDTKDFLNATKQKE